MSNKFKKYHIRFNTSSKSEDDRWRLIEEDGKEILVSSIVVNGHSYTTKNWIEDLEEYKWHISCEGYCTINDNIARIETIKNESALTRHILKTVSYRMLGTLTTVVVAYSLGVPLEISSMLGIGELLLKPVIYFLHERAWYKWIRIGIKK